MKNPIPWDELAKYFAGELSEEQNIEFEQWVNAVPERKKRIEKLHKIWREARYHQEKVNISEAWEKLSLKMDEMDEGTLTSKGNISKIRPINSNIDVNRHHGKWKKQRPGRRTTGFLLLAALIVLAVSVSVLIFYSQTMDSSGQTESPIVQQLVAGEGERATYILGDGSRVVLHAESQLDVPVQFSENSRELYLDGEAYFEVEHDSARPFIVRSENSQTRVLGTKFLIKAWSKISSEVEVVVSEGEVTLGQNSGQKMQAVNEVHIGKNQRGVLGANTEPQVSNVTDMDWYLGWITGKLVFDDRSFNEVITKLERWYVIDIELEDLSIGEQRLSAEIDYSQPMTEVLKAIALSLDAEYERDDRTIIFRSAD